MKRVGGWFNSSSATSSAPGEFLSALDEPQTIQDAMTAASFILNDEVERAEAELIKGTSPFHKLGQATTLFLRATLGFEKEVMQQAAARLAEAEEAASNHQRRAARDPSTAHKSKIYLVGAEYALCHAQSLLMSAVVAVLNESLTESLRGFYKLRKAFSMLHEIAETEKKYLDRHFSSPSSSKASLSKAESRFDNNTAITSTPDPTVLTPANVDVDSEDEDDDLAFEDAEEGVSKDNAASHYQGNIDFPEHLETQLHKTHIEPPAHVLNGRASDSSPTATTEDSLDFTTVTSDPVDLFIHSGTAMCYGLLQLLLSLVPPAFSRLLSILSFRGDRENGLRLLWSATAFKHNINGGMAGLVTLGFHNAAIGVCDIHSREAYPQERILALLHDMRLLYPKSVMWVLEEARMANVSRDPKRADKIMRSDSIISPLRQVEALRAFESSLTLLYLHRYEDCAKSFLKCVDLNSWSHAMYYYNAGCCYVELYRSHRESDPKMAAEYKQKAKTLLLEQVTAHIGKKRFMARQLPMDVFISRKITKWTHRAKTQNCEFIDAIGVSPIEEMIYIWSGFIRMSEKDLLVSLDRLSLVEQNNPVWDEAPADERAVQGLLQATCLRNLGRVEEARATLAERVFCFDSAQIKACDHADNWPLAVAHYEHAVCFWQDAGGQDGDRKILQRCSDELHKVEQWESFEMDARIGLKLTTARETLRRIGISTS